MKARHACAVLGVATSVAAALFMRSLVTTSDAQSLAVAERLLRALPVGDGALVSRLAIDYRPDGRVMQGPPLVAVIATRPGVEGIAIARSAFAARRLAPPQAGDVLVLAGRGGAYRLPVSSVLDWDVPAGRGGYPNAFVSPETAASMAEEWTPFRPQTAESLAPLFMSDASRNFDRARALLLWAAVLTAICLLANTLVLSVEARRREIAMLRTIGMTRLRAALMVVSESAWLSAAGCAAGTVLSFAALAAYVAADPETFPHGPAFAWGAAAAAAALTPVAALAVALFALRPALSVRPLEAASAARPRRRHAGMAVTFAFGFGAFVAVEVWGASLMSAFVPSAEWPDAIVSILPGGVSSFDIEKLRGLGGVKWIAELQPLQANILPLEKLRGFADSGDGARQPARGRPGARPAAQYRNALLLASDRLPRFRYSSGSPEEAEKAVLSGDACIVTEMMARARGLSAGDEIALDCGRGHVMRLKIAGIADLNWHMVTSRGLLRGLNRMPVNTDGPLFVSFDTLAACDPRPQDFVRMTHLWLDYEPAFLAEHGAFEAGRVVEREIVEALNGADTVTREGEVRGNTVRLHSRDEIADGTLAHGADIVGAMSRVPFIFIVVASLGFIAMLVASADSRRREFAVLRAVGATRWNVALLLAREALAVASAGIAAGIPAGALAGWLFTFATRSVMSNWGLPASFCVPWATVAVGALLAAASSLAVAAPAAFAVAGRRVS